jgi:peptidoglycan/LPS O-acetylase OafA/YrhL
MPSGRANNFDVLRLAAATAVLVSHCFGLVGQPEPKFPLTDRSLGDVAVLVFFAISGFLITRSWLGEPRLLPFAGKRLLRIMPALIVAVAVTSYVLGPLATSRGTGSYVTSAAPMHYVVGNTFMLSQYTPTGHWTTNALPPNSVPGVFEHNPLPYANGSLWTLQVEVWAYAFVALGGLLLLRWRPSTRSFWLTAAFGVVVAATIKTGGSTTYPLFLCFAGGAALYLLRARIPLRTGLFLAAGAAWIASDQLPVLGHNLVAAVTLPYMVIFLAFRGIGGLRPLTRVGDVSYGIYVYAWPAQQTVIQLTGTRDPAVVLALAGPTTYLLALGSWYLIERPALRLKRRFAGSGLTSGRIAPLGSSEPAPESVVRA